MTYGVHILYVVVSCDTFSVIGSSSQSVFSISHPSHFIPSCPGLASMGLAYTPGGQSKPATWLWSIRALSFAPASPTRGRSTMTERCMHVRGHRGRSTQDLILQLILSHGYLFEAANFQKLMLCPSRAPCLEVSTSINSISTGNIHNNSLAQSLWKQLQPIIFGDR